MRKSLIVACLLTVESCSSRLKSDFCDLVNHHATNNGRAVCVRARVELDYHGTYLRQLRGEQCDVSLRLIAGPRSSQNQSTVRLVDDETYRRFDQALYEINPETKSPKWSIQATFWGRFELVSGVSEPDPQVRIGKGMRFVLERVTELHLDESADQRNTERKE